MAEENSWTDGSFGAPPVTEKGHLVCPRTKKGPGFVLNGLWGLSLIEKINSMLPFQVKGEK